GNGTAFKAPSVPKTDKIAMMKKMAKMDMKMGAHALKFKPKKDERFKMKKKYGMQRKEMNMDDSNKTGDTMETDKDNKMVMKKEDDLTAMKKSNSEMDTVKMAEMDKYSEYNYDFLKSPEKTNFDKDIPVKEILLNLTGNMQRYIWSMNGVPLSEADKIKIEGNQITRITLNNLTMMHHPMHLHGHFFRVINKNGDYSPLKHTVNVPPMQQVTIEFLGNEYGDWFFHCHVLYHVMGGMARVLSYDTPRDPRMKPFPAKDIIAETNRYYTWGMLDAASNAIALNIATSNIRNQFNVSIEYGWNKNLEAEVTYEYYLYDYLRVFGGVNIENEIPKSLDDFNTTAVAGIRYLTPYLFSLDVRVDSELRPRISIGRSIMVFPKFSVFGYYEYQIDLGAVNTLPENKNYMSEVVWSAGAEYMLSRDFSLVASYDNRFGAGAGLSIRF
ncbi:MAG: multicopper oxidase domain-containing protein, partial [Draconibacterium sp.]|nr:multicopper oxidase domain-containing protein [Draconibacterium sp.]